MLPRIRTKLLKFKTYFFERDTLIATGMRFSMVGVLATATYFITANLIMFLGILTPRPASVLAYILGMIVSFTGQSQFSFKVGRVNFRHVTRFVILSILGLLISYFSIVICEDYLDISAVWGTLFTSISIPLLSFIMMKLWVFKDKAA